MSSIKSLKNKFNSRVKRITNYGRVPAKRLESFTIPDSSSLSVFTNVYGSLVKSSGEAINSLFNAHPNVVGPLLSSILGMAVSYTLGSFIGNSLWPTNQIVTDVYNVMVMGTRVSTLGLSAVAIGTPISIVALSKSFGDLAF